MTWHLLKTFIIIWLGWLKPVIGQEFPLSEAAKAQEEVISHSNGTKGKIILSTN